MTPQRKAMLGDGLDQPLIEGFDKPYRKVAERKPGVRTYSGPATTCHPCILAVQAGEPLQFPRAPATWSVLTESGREWLICSGHKALIEAKEVTLE